jgi:hypothetical protein
MVDSISELAGSLQRSGSGNPIALLNLANILAGDILQMRVASITLFISKTLRCRTTFAIGCNALLKNHLGNQSPAC